MARRTVVPLKLDREPRFKGLGSKDMVQRTWFKGHGSKEWDRKRRRRCSASRSNTPGEWPPQNLSV